MRLSGKTALVTGAGSGIGRACALAFEAEGAAVWAADFDPAALETLAAEAPGVNIAQIDVREGASIDALAGRMGGCDVLFNCVGVVPGGTVLDGELGIFNSAFDTNVLSMVRLIRAVLPGMLEAGGGAIINMSSVASSITAAANRCVYGVTKAAIIGLTKSVALDFVGKGIRCNAICPGTVDTPSLRGRASVQGGLDGFIARQPMQRLGKVEEVAALAVYLASDESAFVTGQAFVIDGGWTI